MIPEGIRNKGTKAVQAYANWVRSHPPTGTGGPTGKLQRGLEAGGDKVDQVAQKLSPRYKSMELDRKIAQLQEQLARKPTDGGEL